jgi:hypothetical protein
MRPQKAFHALFNYIHVAHVLAAHL